MHPADSLHWLSDAGLEATADEIHNAYGTCGRRLVYENQVERYPEDRPVILMRSGFVGSQRYGMIPWTGDVSRSWGGLKPQIELSCRWACSGSPTTIRTWAVSRAARSFDKEMYIRWLQYGVFQPILSAACAGRHRRPEPVFHDRETRRIVRDFVKLRYQDAALHVTRWRLREQHQRACR